MKVVTYLLVFAFLFTSCKAKKHVINGTTKIRKMSAKKTVKKHIAANFDKKTVEAKFKVVYKDKKNSLGFSVRMRMIKDEVIWLKGTKLITAFKVKITPTSVRYYSPLNKTFFEGDFSMAKEFLGVEMNFEQLQNLLLGQAIMDLKSEKQRVEIQENAHVLSPKNQQELFSIFFFVNPTHYKLNKQTLVNTAKKQQLDILYPTYSVRDAVVFPDEIKISAQQGDNTTRIHFTTRSVVFDTDVNVSFRIPSGYKQIRF